MRYYKFLLILLLNVILILEISSADDYRVKLKKGIENLNSSSSDSSENIFQDLIVSSPKRPGAYAAMAVLKIDQNDLVSARNYANKALSIRPSYGLCNYLLGIIEERSGNYHASAAYYKKFLELTPDSSKRARIMEKLKFLDNK